MKTVLSLFTAVLLATHAPAQISLAPEAGINMADMAIKFFDPLNGLGGTVRTALRTSVTAGITAEYSLNQRFHLQTGAFYMGNGCKVEPGEHIYINSVQVPLTFEYRQGTSWNTRFYAGAGPYVAYNLDGTTNLLLHGRDLKFGSDTSCDVKRIDFGLGLHVGLLLANNFYLRIRYQTGLINLQPHGDNYNSIRTSAIGITIGYYLTGNKTRKPVKVTRKPPAHR